MPKRNLYPPFYYIFLVTLIFLSLPSFTEEVEINLVYTNDIHDNIRPSYSGIGGLPYIAGFVKQLRAEKTNVILVDAGDLTDKGDMVADVTNGEIMYQAVEKMGYQVMVVGNHDIKKGIEQLCKLKQLAPSVDIVTTDYKEGLEHCYKPWVIKKVGDLPVGFVGIINFRIENIKPAIDEMKRKGCYFFVALCHLGSGTCKAISKKIPEISIFVSGHTHEILEEPIVCPDTNALIVQSGSRAIRVGYLKILVDTQKQNIKSYENKLVELKHDVIKPDEDLLNWIYAEEKRACPLASEFLIDNKKTINASQIAILTSHAIKEKTDVDIALCPPKLIRNVFPPNKLDYNAVFLTTGHRALEKEWIQITLKGKQIEQYLKDILKNHWDITECAGMEFQYKDKTLLETNLILDKDYRIAISKTEFQNQLLRSLRMNNEKDIENIKNELTEYDFTYLDVLSELFKKINNSGLTLDAYVDRMNINSNNENNQSDN
ncbi:MAG TPA: metallophosphoesterase [Candidatus Hydrogenedens sp.]|nr:metallophosphoesterase [Candidatus Hydrogenedens sp.]HOL20281.1 metallophosphoesterase [Candidatus Hydrogenedens sp.]HPP58133.1 metallophosphoesterase [Candidatus Hydrogenedens sp.]